MNKTRRFKVDKLIRDKIPEITLIDGVTTFTRELDLSEYIKRLNDKLIEEAKEVIQAKDKMEIAEELADVLEVINAIASVSSLSLQDIEDTRLKKKAAKGGFEKGIYCSFIEMPSDNQRVSHYLSRAEEYPEIK